ncbi:UNVERIFIED_CONTAM: hypothetical protein GTU68_053030 [Idotea baltica]|nr:hypothetical protein [Idotea baltica]
MFNRIFTYFESFIEPFPNAPAARPPSTLIPFLWHYSKTAWPWLLVMAVLTALISILEVSLFNYLGNLIDWLSSSDRSTFLQSEAGKLMWIATIVLVLLPLVGFVHSIVLHQTVIGNYPMSIRWGVHRYLLGQSYSFFQDEFAGRVATKVMQTSLAIRETVMKVLDTLTYVGVYFLSAMVLLASFDFWLVLPFLIWVLAYALLLRYFLPKLKAISRKQADARSEMTGRVVDSYTNIMTVKLFAHSGREARYAKQSMNMFLETVHPQMRYSTQLISSIMLLNGVLLFGIGAASISLWINSAISVGAVAVAVGLVLRLQGMSMWIMWELSHLFESIGVVYDGMGMISRDNDVKDLANAQALAPAKGHIEFDQVRFHYGRDTGAIESMSLDIASGEKIGLVGRSGAGKTTFTNLLLRLYDVESGSINIDGVDISSITQESLRQQIGVVTQDTSLLHRSVFDNIAYGQPDATHEQVISAATRANAHEFIQDLVDSKGRQGYDAQVGERGVKLSGGQRQRIAIARMFLKDAPILVLDEATSALDSEVEAAIQDNLSSLMQGKTVIAIAHRLSTIAMMDRLIVMDEGRIIEQGTHDELVEAGSLYAQLWQRQSGGFLTRDEKA